MVDLPPVRAAMSEAISRPPRRGSGGYVVRTRGLTKQYGSLTAVDKLDLEVHPGEIFGLLGQNGAGKTTTILMLLGLTEPTSGAARVMGLDPTREPRRVKRRVGYLPDAVGFYGGLTGRQNLRYTARLNGLRGAEAEASIQDVLEQVGLVDRGDDPVEQYSRGMRQRLGIADALVKTPDLLILDEPTAAIDPIGVVEILDLLRRLVDERGLAILLSSHLLSQVQSVCDRIGIFAAGKLVGQGTVEELASAFGDGTATIEVGLELTGEADVAACRRCARQARARRSRGAAKGCQRLLAADRPSSRGGSTGPTGHPGRRRRARSPPDGDPADRAVARRHLPLRRGPEGRMSAEAKPRIRAKVRRRPPMAAPEVERTEIDERLPGAGWRVIAAKEFGDHLMSVRFMVLLIVLGLAAAIPLYFAAAQIRSVAPDISGAAAVFVYLFALGAEEIQNLSVFSFLAIVAPLLGLAFAFDAVNGERSEGTLPRLLAQPIYRDDVINGKFAAGMAVIGVVLVSVVLFIAAFGLLRLGIVPRPQEVLRLVLWVGATFVYVAVWLAFGLLLSVLDPSRRDRGVDRVRDLGRPHAVRQPHHRVPRRAA